MKIAVCLSPARHPVSGRPVISRLEAQAIALARGLGGETVGVHVGSETDGLLEALGAGLAAIDRIATDREADPVPELEAYLRKGAFDLVLCGRRGQGGLDTGLVPYCLSDRLGLPLIADAAAISNAGEPGCLVIDQGLARGDRRRIVVRLPAIITIHPLAPPPRAFAFAASRRGTIRDLPAIATTAPDPVSPFTERPFRARPKLMRTASASTGDSGEKLHVQPSPEDAARLILEYLERNGIRSFGSPGEPTAS